MRNKCIVDIVVFVQSNGISSDKVSDNIELQAINQIPSDKSSDKNEFQATK